MDFSGIRWYRNNQVQAVLIHVHFKKPLLIPGPASKDFTKTTFFFGGLVPPDLIETSSWLCGWTRGCSGPPRQDALQRMTLSGMPNEAQWTSALEVPMAERYGTSKWIFWLHRFTHAFTPKKGSIVMVYPKQSM